MLYSWRLALVLYDFKVYYKIFNIQKEVSRMHGSFTGICKEIPLHHGTCRGKIAWGRNMGRGIICNSFSSLTMLNVFIINSNCIHILVMVLMVYEMSKNRTNIWCLSLSNTVETCLWIRFVYLSAVCLCFSSRKYTLAPMWLRFTVNYRYWKWNVQQF